MELLKINNSVSTHDLNLKLQKLAIEMFKNELFQPIVNELMDQRISSHLRYYSNFGIHNVRSVYHSTEIISFLGLKIWGIVPSEFKELC